jgi:seryl-tRNA synthetase
MRYKDSDGKKHICYTLNNTAIASPRVLIALMENHQTSEGKIRIPEPLRPYMQGRSEIG